MNFSHSKLFMPCKWNLKELFSSKVILDFKTTREKLLYRNLMFCAIIIAQYIWCTQLLFCYHDTWHIICS